MFAKINWGGVFYPLLLLLHCKRTLNVKDYNLDI